MGIPSPFALYCIILRRARGFYYPILTLSKFSSIIIQFFVISGLLGQSIGA